MGDLYIGSVLSQQRGIRVAESVPSDRLHNPHLERNGTDESSHDALAPIWILAATFAPSRVEISAGTCRIRGNGCASVHTSHIFGRAVCSACDRNDH